MEENNWKAVCKGETDADLTFKYTICRTSLLYGLFVIACNISIVLLPLFS